MPPPQKKYYRQRAHSNPIADHCFEYPSHPDKMDWNRHYPAFFFVSSPNEPGERDDSVSTSKKEQEEPTTSSSHPQNHQPSPPPPPSNNNRVEFLDVGCGYGGLLVELSPLFPNTLMLGMEIRVKVSDYVQDRIEALRKDNPGKYENVACIRSNAMKYLPNFFHKHQLSKMFFLFPDPHFKKAKHKWRIINPQLLSEYAYVLKIGAIVYTITDVMDLHEWMVKHFTEHPLFRRLEQDELVDDVVVGKIRESTEEGKKVTRNNGDKYMAVFQRVHDPFT